MSNSVDGYPQLCGARDLRGHPPDRRWRAWAKVAQAWASLSHAEAARALRLPPSQWISKA